MDGWVQMHTSNRSATARLLRQSERDVYASIMNPDFMNMVNLHLLAQNCGYYHRQTDTETQEGQCFLWTTISGFSHEQHLKLPSLTIAVLCETTEVYRDTL